MSFSHKFYGKTKTSSYMYTINLITSYICTASVNVLLTVITSYLNAIDIDDCWDWTTYTILLCSFPFSRSIERDTWAPNGCKLVNCNSCVIHKMYFWLSTKFTNRHSSMQIINFIFSVEDIFYWPRPGIKFRACFTCRNHHIKAQTGNKLHQFGFHYHSNLLFTRTGLVGSPSSWHETPKWSWSWIIVPVQKSPDMVQTGDEFHGPIRAS